MRSTIPKGITSNAVDIKKKLLRVRFIVSMGNERERGGGLTRMVLLVRSLMGMRIPEDIGCKAT